MYGTYSAFFALFKCKYWGAMIFNSQTGSSFFGSSISIRWWTYVRYCRSAMAEKLFSTGPGVFRRAERKETIDDLDRTSCDNFWNGSREERVLIATKTRRRYSECVRVRVSGVTNRPAKWVAWNCREATNFIEKSQTGILPTVSQGLSP